MGKARRAPKGPQKIAQGSGGGAHQLVTFWGVRGTMPTPGKEFSRYGGHTPCVEIRSVQPDGRSSSIVCDGGSGLIRFGETALRRGDRVFHVLLSHMHYDHMMGFQKFSPLFRTDCEIHLYGLSKGGASLRELFSRYFAFPFFPLEFKDLPSVPNLHFHEVNGLSGVLIDDCRVEFQALHHPQQAVGFRVWSADVATSLVYATDHEHGTPADEALVEFCRDTTLFLYDSTFSQESYPKFVGWGHSTAFKGAQFAQMAGARSFGLFHHDPDAPDDLLERALLPEARRIFPASFLSREGDVLHMAALRDEGVEKARLEGEFFRFSQRSAG